MPALHIYNANVNIIFETTKKSRILIDAAFLMSVSLRTEIFQIFTKSYKLFDYIFV